MRRTLLFALAMIGLSVALQGCALLHKSAKWATVTPVRTPDGMAPADSYYLAAKSAIDRRDYAAALELLQQARARKADDADVLNAMGVVYDKLGRFDLSSRYYGQAAALDPGSPMIAHNLAYSKELQALQGGPGQRQLATAQASPPARVEVATPKPSAPVTAAADISPRLVSAGPNVLRLELPAPLQVADKAPTPTPTPPPAPTPAPGWRTLAVGTGAHLMVINATGTQNGADPLRLTLAEKGWSARAQITPVLAPEAVTIISYPSSKAETAKALARTLPLQARMEPCAKDCTGVRLVVGADAVGRSLDLAHLVKVARR